MTLPKGLFHFAEHMRDFDSNMRLPDFSSPVDLGGRMNAVDNQISGFYLPMPYGMDPINLQVFREIQRDKEIAGTGGYAEEAQRALTRARSICRHAATPDCDTALQKYHELRMAEKNEEEAPLHERLIRLTDMLGTTKLRNEENNGLGVLFGMPGIKPVFWRAKVRNADNNGAAMQLNNDN